MRTLHLNAVRCFLFPVISATFVFSGNAALVTTQPATGFTTNSATLNGTANPGGVGAFGHFEYGLTTSYGSQTGDDILGNGNNNVNFSQSVSGLVGSHFYHYRADVVVLGIGTVQGNDQAFFLPGAPLVNILAASSIHPGEAVLNATLNPNNTNNVITSYWFQHGATTNYGSVTPASVVPSGTNLVAVNQLITGLPRGQSYHFRAMASNIFGQSFSADLSFSVPQGATVPGGSTGGGQAFDLRQPALELNFLICTNGVFPEEFNAVPVLGQICLFAGNFAPAGWVLCQGQLLSLSNTALFSLIGTTFGGDGVNTFALPDFQGFRPIGVGQGNGLSSWFIGQRNGSTQPTLSSFNLPAHSHSLPFPDSVTGTTGNGQMFSIVQPSLAINFLVAVEGIFPIQGSTTITEPFLGEIVLYGGFRVPEGGISANGQVISISQNTALNAVIGTNFGGNGQTTFQLPDLQSRVPVGTGQGQSSQWSLAERAGAEITGLATTQMPAHQHTVPSTGAVTGFTGNSQPFNIIQPSLVLQYLISTNGDIPSPTVQTRNTMLGEIQIYAGTNVPVGWLPCDGRLLQKADAPALFSVISNWYGGDSSTTFALPNLCGRVPIGCTNGQPGAAYGTEQTVLSVANLPPHTHTGPALDFDRWITSFGLSGAMAAFDADSDNDGAKNGYEWVTGNNPTNATSPALLAIESAGNNVLVSFPRNTNARDVILTLQRTFNLADPNAWVGIATNTAGTWNPSAAVTETGINNPVNVSVSDLRTNHSTANYRLDVVWP